MTAQKERRGEAREGANFAVSSREGELFSSPFFLFNFPERDIKKGCLDFQLENEIGRSVEKS